MPFFSRTGYRGIFFIATLTLVAGFSVGWFLGRSAPTCWTDFKFINDELRCASGPVIKKAAYTVLQKDISAYFAKEVELGKLKRAAVFFRDLKNGPTFGINETSVFIPASLLKLPLVVTYFRLAEEDPSIFEERLIPSEEGGQWQYFAPTVRVTPGASYTVRELLFHTIAYSDNAAYFTLVKYLADSYVFSNPIEETLREIGILEPKDEWDQIITTKSYASIFRLLYNASYISNEHSDEVLSMLARSQFFYGITSGIPRSMPIAHKFGERSDISGELKQLHDYGIVFYPQNPYLLCVMTEGKTFSELLEIIQTVSRAVYTKVESRKIP